jgi:hypothetical protein
MPCSVTALYPNTPDATFNLEYYTSTHLPMVAEQFGPYGFKGAYEKKNGNLSLIYLPHNFGDKMVKRRPVFCPASSSHHP